MIKVLIINIAFSCTTTMLEEVALHKAEVVREKVIALKYELTQCELPDIFEDEIQFEHPRTIGSSENSKGKRLNFYLDYDTAYWSVC